MSSSSDDKRPTRVLQHLFIGSRVHAKNRGLLQELGINRILNVTPPRTMDPTNGVPSFFEKDRSMTYKRVAVFDNRGEDLLQHFQSCISFIEQGSFYGRVLVHCNKGVSRSSTVVAAYLMSTRGLSKYAAMAYLVARRPIVNPHEGFTAQLKAFETKLRRERDAAIADGQEKKFPDDLLPDSKTKQTASGAPIGPIGPPRGPSGPSRGPSGPSPAPKNAKRNTSPMRGPSRGPAAMVGPSGPPRKASPVRGPSRGPTAMVGPPGPPVSTTTKKGAVGKAAVAKGGSASPPRPRHGGGAGDVVGPSRGPLPRPSVDDARGEEAGGDGGSGDGGGGDGGGGGGGGEALRGDGESVGGGALPIGPAIGPPSVAGVGLGVNGVGLRVGEVSDGAVIATASAGGEGGGGGGAVDNKRRREEAEGGGVGEAEGVAEGAVQKARVGGEGGAANGKSQH